MNTFKSLSLSVAMALASLTPLAQASHGPAASDAALTDGEIRKVDKEAGKLTIRHGEIKKLEMPGMTMVFRIHNPQLLERLQPGDKVRFDADRIDGAIVVTHIEPVQ